MQKDREHIMVQFLILGNFIYFEEISFILVRFGVGNIISMILGALCNFESLGVFKSYKDFL